MTRDLQRRLGRRRDRHLARGRVYRIAFTLAGLVVLATGLLLLVLPGPGLPLIAAGLAMLALEFAWAERWLVRSLEALDRTRRAATAGRARSAAAAAGLVVAVAAAIAAILIWDIPYLPF